MALTRDFHNDLAASQTPENEAAIIQAIRNHYPDARNIMKSCIENDKAGADWWIEFTNNKVLSLDAKIRTKDYTTTTESRIACIEIVANTTTGKAGWSIDPNKISDIVMFYYIDTKKAYFYPARELRNAIIANLDRLKAHGKPDIQRTRTSSGFYTSESLFVSHVELWRCMYLSNTKQAA
jgi:hypothetical protein